MKATNYFASFCLALAISSSPASADTILLTDNFNEAAANDQASTFNNNLATTQGGTLATVTYNVLGSVGYSYTSQHSNEGSMILANISGLGYGNVSLNHNFAAQANAANQPLRVSFKLSGVFGYDGISEGNPLLGDPTRWVQCNIGNSQNLRGIDFGVGAAVAFTAGGGSFALSDTVVLPCSGSTWTANNIVTITLSGTGGVGSAFNGNGSEASITVGANNLGTFTLAQQTNAYLTFSAYSFGDDLFGYGAFDNLSVALIGPGSDYATWGAPYSLSTGSEGLDLDHDGVSNFEEYAFALIPNSGASVNPITAQLNKSNGKFSYQRRDDSLSELTYSVWFSENLSGWTQDTPASVVVTPIPSSSNEAVEVTLSNLPGDPQPAKLFVQVRAD